MSFCRGRERLSFEEEKQFQIYVAGEVEIQGNLKLPWGNLKF
jgi:hypothetical protein